MGSTVPIVAGVVSGIAGAWLGTLFLSQPGSAPTVKDAAPAAKEKAAPAADGPLVTRTMGAATACDTGEGSRDGAGSVKASARAPTPRSDPAEREKHLQVVRHAQEMRVVAHQQEPRDANWAVEKERTLNTGIARLAADGAFKLENVECRSVSCVAKLSWPQKSDAEQQMFRFVTDTSAFSPEAVRFFTLDSDNETGSVGATLVIDYTHQSETLEEK